VGQFFTMIWSWLLGLFEAVGEFFRGTVEDFKESNRYFKIKVWLVAGYAAVGLITAVVFIPPGELNEIGAEVRMSKMEVIGGRYFLVANHSSDTWKHMLLTLNGRYAVRWPRLRPGKKKAYFINRFKDKRDRPPDERVQADKLRIDCSEGSFERDYSRRH